MTSRADAVTVRYTHPLNDPDFAAEVPACRAEVIAWWTNVTEIDKAPRTLDAIQQIAALTGHKFGQVKAMFYKWRNEGRTWQALVNRAKYPDPRLSQLPPEFKGWVYALYLQHQRDQTWNQTYRTIMQRLSDWEREPLSTEKAIPGYSAPPRRDPFKHHPEGWSKDNLRKACLPNKFERALRRRGPKAASEFLPSVYTTRVGLAFGQLFYFDDQWHDTHINVLGINSKTLRPQSFNCIEALSGFSLEPGLRPQIWDEEKSKRSELSQLDFFWFVMHVLTRVGYNAVTGTVLIFEHGTANVDKTGRFEEELRRLTEGKVLVDRSGLWRNPAFAGLLFEGKSTGNFRFKAPIESWFNLLRNYSAALPAPTGRNPECSPEENHGLIAYNEQLLALRDRITPQQWAVLQRPVLDWELYARMHREINAMINGRRDHELEGWAKLNFTGARYRLTLNDKAWMGEQEWFALPPEQRAVLQQIVTQDGYHETFRLSPAEVWERHTGQLTKLPMHSIPLLAPERAWEDVTVSPQLEMTIRDPFVDSEPLRYLAKIRDSRGYEVILERGKTYKRLINIFDPSVMWISEVRGAQLGALIGTAERLHVPCKVDQEAIVERLKDVSHIRSVESAAVRVSTEGVAAERQAMRERNDEVLRGGVAAPRRKPTAKADRKANQRQADVLSARAAIARQISEDSSLR